MNKRICVVGITGFARSGKDTVADYLVKHHGYTKLSFAEPIKQACKAIFGFNHEQLHGDLKEVPDKYWNITPRQAFQKVGTDLLRDQFDKDIWIKALQKQVELNYEMGIKRIVISDVRFDNEISYLKSMYNTSIWKVKRHQVLSKCVLEHKSERPDDLEFDYVLYNTDTLDNLYKQVNTTLRELYNAHYEEGVSYDDNAFPELYCMNCEQCILCKINSKL